MGVRWAPRESGGSLNWASRTSTTQGVINGSADVFDTVETDLLLIWEVNSAVTSDLTLLWQVDANPITAVESDLSLTWNVITAAGTSVERDLVLLWQREGSVTSNLSLVWQLQGEPSEPRESVQWVAQITPQGVLTQVAA
jgi:glycerol kinase